MYPSFPSFERESSLSVRFAVPNKTMVCRILEDCEQEENLRIKAAGNILFRRIQTLAKLMNRHRIQVDSIAPNELGVTLFLPPPPCPPPNPETTTPRRKKYKQRLQTIQEESEVEIKKKRKEWITLYEYLPSGKRDAMYADVERHIELYL